MRFKQYKYIMYRLFTSRGCDRCEASFHEAVVYPPRMERNEADVVRSVRPMGKKCRHLYKLARNQSDSKNMTKYHIIKLISLKQIIESTVFMNNL